MMWFNHRKFKRKKKLKTLSVRRNHQEFFSLSQAIEISRE